MRFIFRQPRPPTAQPESKMTKRLLLVLPVLAFTFSACKKNVDVTPSWLVIDEFSFTTNVSVEGEATHNITDAWVYMDGQALGVFELPAKIPIIDEGTHEFDIWAGIKNNGISATRKRYPFYDKWVGDINLVKNDTVYLTPDITYKSNLDFELMEDFEDSGIDFGKDALSDTSIVFITETEYPDIVQWGDKCGGVFLTSTDSLFKGITDTDLDLPGGGPVYLEVDYLNTNSIAFGLVAQNSTGVADQGPIVLMNRQEPGTEVWKKIYIDLEENVSFEIFATSWEAYFVSVLDPENPSSGFVYLDNIKIIHY